MKKFPKIRYPNDPETDGLHNGEVVVTEKLDGANFRFTWDADADELVVGTRNHVYNHDDENLPKAFEHAVEYVKQCIEQSPTQWQVAFKSGLWTLYGEAMHLHTLDYEGIDWHNPHKGSPHVPLDNDQPNVVLFDIRDEEGWLSWDDFTDAIHDSQFEHAPVLERGDPDDLDFEVPDESMFGGPPEGSDSDDGVSQKSRDDSTTRPEGIVARRVDGTVRAKKVTDDFKETNSQVFNNPSKAQSDAAEFVAAFVTPQRVKKQADKLVDEGEYDALTMEMMKDLPREVLKDVLAEEGWNLLTSGGFEAEWDDEFKGEVRSKASKKCARVLKKEVQEF